MKVLFDTRGIPFFLAHGGATTQILSTFNALSNLGIKTEFARWWDPQQRGDVLHVFGAPSLFYIDFARDRGMPIVNTTLFTEACNRSRIRQSSQGAIIRAVSAFESLSPVRTIQSKFSWKAYAACSANIVGLTAEADVLMRTYQVPSSRIHVIPLGIDKRFISDIGAGSSRACGDHLITTGTITPRKRSAELASLAISAQTPVRFVGKPYDTKSHYWKEFESLIDGNYVQHVDHVSSVEEMVQILQESRGFVTFTERENWCLSAHEAAASGLPLLLPDQRWSRERFGNSASFLRNHQSGENSKRLKRFFEEAPTMKPSHPPAVTWDEVARQLVNIYRTL